MYAEFFGLQHDPFSIAPDPRYLFMSERHREALAHLLYGVRGGGGFVLLSGEIGAGKTTICRCFLEQVPENCNVAYIFNPRLTVADLLKSICREFRIEVKHEGLGPATVHDHLDPLNEFLLASHARGERNLLIIDEAQNLTPHVLEQLRLLTNLETSERKLLQIILIGQPELRAIVARPELEQLAQRVIARFHLGALDAAETREYIQHRLQVAGLKGPLPFAPAAIERIHDLSRGVPRRINLLCDRALLGAYANGQNRVERAVVDKAASEVFDSDGTTPAPRRAATAAATRTSGLGTLGMGALAGAVVGALVAAAALWFWLQRPGVTPVAADGAPAGATASASPPIDEAAPAPAAQAPQAPAAQADPVPAAADTPAAPTAGWPGADALITAESDAWRELAPLWGQALAGADPCEQALDVGLQCYRTARMTLHGLRQLDRPGILNLRLPDGASGRLLLTALDENSAVVARGERRWRVPLGELADAWRGDYATLWRLPPGQSGRLADGRDGPAGRWLNERIVALQAAGSVPASGVGLAARLAAFQRSRGIEAGGPAGPVTFMQINLASGVDEPRLLPRS
ncbi:MAG: AAA family ATPase [Hydrogenophaga sp.]|uniref:ExeA family protein n=1 Tax=Hydrogenophaga sp. TaxID=1904254 RepID=UPI0016AA23F8|nr:AAA family ATPase [Hydrogenophaga sp.]NIM43523.1 AAA family ATPase [Hydrogenophaga sp.]NIN28592.1 AAA family ATPase [Hydrogenophaga sp.]NIN33051.1 AAA family ATPase [Hydrogenophaga sp.]NIN57726.1 AAA family ATPase [Hydrogenophaga sp.]NIO54021.1 AAA family ATPase [Hydrogenophaga sp.]